MLLDARRIRDVDLPAVRAAVVATTAAADGNWHEQASRRGDGNGAEKQEDGYEAS
jgi:hypothetical protein